MNEQKYVRIIGTTKDYMVFPDELGNFPETVQIAELPKTNI